MSARRGGAVPGGARVAGGAAWRDRGEMPDRESATGAAPLRDAAVANGRAEMKREAGPPPDFVLSDVADPGLAAVGLARIGWAERAMPVLGLIRDRFERQHPFAGLAVAACLHVTAETAVLVNLVTAGGAPGRPAPPPPPPHHGPRPPPPAARPRGTL